MLEQAQALASELVRLRRDIHAHPELSFTEMRTAGLVAETLSELGGFTVRTGIAKTGVVGEIGNGDGPTIAIRADMDALPIIEATNTSFASGTPGVMHACGHDAHTAMLLGAAHLLREQFARGSLRGRVRLLFQPSEEAWDREGKSGGLRMVEEGVMEGVDAVIALHVDSTLPLGKVTIRGGWTSAAVDDFEAVLLGSGGHGAAPHEGTDPVFMLIPVLTALYGIKARRLNPVEPAILSVGIVQGGGATNVIPSEVRLAGTLRSYSPQIRDQLSVEVERAVAVTRGFGGDYRLKINRGYPAGWNDERVAGWLGQVAGDFLGSETFDHSPAGLGAEDFAYMCQKSPGAMLMLGAAIDDGVMRAHHTPIFDIDERCLPVGAAILAETAARFLKGDVVL
ncbi:MAG: M20 metallopeptidase family protein [Oscillochloridaceae bacterium umkhey_bin13]